VRWRRLAIGFAGFVVAFVLVNVLQANGLQNAPLVVFAAALVAGAVLAIVIAKGW
jgi:hypothetical protein